MSETEKVVIDEKISRTSDVVPTLFVGLGGCGMRIIRRIRKHLRARPDYRDRYAALTRFAAVDTNINELEESRADVDEIFLISDFEKEAYAALASGKSFLDEDEHFTQWVPKDYRFRAGDTAGAGQIRIESRLGCYYTMRHSDFLTKMRRLVEELKTHENGYRRLEPREVRVVIAFSVAGGTGSGAHLAMSYVLRDMVAEVGQPTIIGAAVMPTVFDQIVGVNKDGTNANGYAALKEIEHLMRLGSPVSDTFPRDGVRFHYNGGAQSMTVVRTKPFDFLYVIDKPESFTVDNVPHAAGDGLYLQLFSGIFKDQAGDYDNYTQHQRVLVPHDFAAKGIQGFTSFYATFGAAVMTVPSDGIIQYCSQIAALGLMKDNFLRTPPASPVYKEVRTGDKYFTVRSDRGDDVNESEFDKRGKETDSLRDALFLKRVRLLARAELNAKPNSTPDYSDVFQHGHGEDEAPTEKAEVGMEPGAFGTPKTYSLEEKFKHRLYQAVVGSFRAEIPGQPQTIALVRKAVQAAEDAAKSVRRVDADATTSSGKTEGWLKKEIVFQDAASSAEDSARQAVSRGRQALLQALENGDINMNGFARLKDADFLRNSEATLTQRRYAALMLLRDLPFELLKDVTEPNEFSAGEVDEAAARTDAETAFAEAFKPVSTYFTAVALYEVKKFLDALKSHLDEFCRVLRDVDGRFDAFAHKATKDAEILRLAGGAKASAFILDGEALTIETGRRMWDFFYVDCVMESVRGRRDRDFQRDIADKLGIGERKTRISPDVLDELFRLFVDKTAEDVAPIVAGDPSKNRKPLGIHEAIQLEIAYRDVYLSNRERIDKPEGSLDEVKMLIMQQRELVKKEKVKTDPAKAAENQDYLRDKFRRLIREKADYLCLYDESRDQQGGVRPDKYDAVAMTKGLADSDPDLVDAIKAASGKKPKIVTEGWTDEQTIVFYKAVLNVPLYVFGRMNAMKDHYHRFRGQRFQSKVLHIDHNWEHSLPDLDPEAAFDRHQTQLLDQNVLFFAALHVARGPGDRRLVRLSSDKKDASVSPEQFYEVLERKDTTDRKRNLADIDDPDANQEKWTQLGSLIADAARNLPDVLERRKQANMQYFVYRTQLMRGLLPRALIDAFDLAKDWRNMFEDLRTNLVERGGANERKLRDIEQTLHSMMRAAESLATRLSDESLISGRFGDAIEASELHLDPKEARLAIEQSIVAARGFAEYAHNMLKAGVDQVREPLDADFFGHGPGGESTLWGPMSKEELKERLGQLAGTPKTVVVEA